MSSSPAIDWSTGAPRATAFDDGYFALGDGLAESRAVFLAGLGLPDAWAGRDRHTVGELGFGTGLNVLALLQLWSTHRPSADARLHVFSVEAFPLAPADARRALGAWPELAELAAPLLDAWPRGRAGLHRFAWPGLGATLDLHVGEALAGVEGWAGAADGWMLDGFAPSRNPDMWRPELLAAVAGRSRPGARAATFTVAGVVRRGLEAAGFDVAKRHGHGAKRERLEARLPGAPPSHPPRPTVAVVGAGIAGAALARALRLEGLGMTVVAGADEGASANAAALVTPRLDAGLGPAARLGAVAFAHAVRAYAEDAPKAVIARGALRLAAGDRDEDRFDRIAASDLFDPDALARAKPAEASGLLGEPVGSAALLEADALVVEPDLVRRTWLAGARRVEGEAVAVAPYGDGDGWRVLDAEGRTLARADVVVLAGGAAGARLLPGLELRPVRGQVETAAGVDPGGAAAWGGYAVPTRDGALWGATHVRGDTDTAPRPSEREANLTALAAVRPRLAEALAALPEGAVESRAAVRATTADHLPLAGPVPDAAGLWTLTGLGGRGFTWAPLLAEEVAARIAGAPPPLPRDLARLVAPDAPARAGRRRSRPSAGGPERRPSAPVALPRRTGRHMTTPLKPLSAQCVVITGATSGIGLATARLLSGRGARLVLVARNETALTSLADELRAKGGQVEPVAADVADEAALRRAAAVAEARFGGFDAWVNNAGVLIYGRLSDVPLEDHRRLFETNYWGAVNGSRIAVEHLRGRPGGGVLLNMGSVLGDFPAPIQGVYCASKHALKGFTNALRMELLTDAPDVTVTLVKPSAIDTPISERSRSLLATAGSNPPPLYATPLVAEAVAYALTRRTRELTVGFGGRALAWMGQFLSPLAEPLFSRVVPLLATNKDAPPGPGTLHAPGRDLRERGPYPVVLKSSLWLQAQKRPEITAAAVGGAAVAAWAVLRIRRALRHHEIRREVRARYEG